MIPEGYRMTELGPLPEEWRMGRPRLDPSTPAF